jgi:hypothetical protein
MYILRTALTAGAWRFSKLMFNIFLQTPKKSEKSSVSEKLDLLLEMQKQSIATEASRWETLTDMWNRQHAERMSVMKDLINSLNK